MTVPWHPSPDASDPAVDAPPDAPPAAPAYGWTVEPSQEARPQRTPGRWRREFVWALAIAATVTLLGFPLGWLWSAITPKVQVVMTPQGVWYAQTPRFEEAAAGDGWFVFITAGAGAAVAVVVWLVIRAYRGPVMLVALAAGSVACAVIAAWFGHRIGLAEYERWVHTAAVGQHFHKPAELGTKRVGLWFGVLPRVQGAVLVQAAAAVSMYTMLAGFHRAPSLRDEDGRAMRAAPPPGAVVSSGWPAYPAPSTAPAPPAPGTAAAPPD